ncbi:MAG: DNA-processing protein DprA, partial [Pseudomonadota bacterium]
GLENTRLFGKYLAKGGFAITSGLALGIDGAAHKAALEVGGKTVAVTATGIDQVYPKQHLKLADSIIDNDGLIVTEFMPGTEAHAARFPQRNRIISGLSLGVLVIEAAAKSGSLITARYALEQNREVFAVPSSIHNPQAKGCHSLIKQGAHLIETGEDIIKHLAGIICLLAEQQARSESSPAEQQALSEINASPNTTNGATKLSAHKKLSNKEQKMVNEIGYDRVHIEQLIDRTGLASAEVAAILLNLEIKGIVKHSDWGYEAIQSLTDSPGL